MIKVTVKEGCTTYGIYTNSVLSLREILLQYIHKADDDEIENVISDIVRLNGTWTSLGYCEQCNDTYGEYELEIKDIND